MMHTVRKLVFPTFIILAAGIVLATPGTFHAAGALVQVEPVSITSQVSASADDAEEAISNGDMDLTSSDLELGADGSTLQYAGMRFNNIAIPYGASILSAYVDFEVDETGSDPTSVLIHGQAIDNAPAFSNANYDISSRAHTVAQVAWNDIPAWPEKSTKWQTPDLAPIIQEIVSRPGWAAGNSIVLIVNGSGRRTAEAYDGEIPAAPKLIIQYTSGDVPTPGTSSVGPQENTQTIRFAVIGDYGEAGSAERDVASLVKSWRPDIIITTGDNNYPDGAADTIDANVGQYYHEFIHPYVGSYGTGAAENRFFPLLGNHDWRTVNAQPYLDYFTLPGNERYYDFVWGPVHFFAIDSDDHEPDGREGTSAQALWLKAQLAASTSSWNLVYMHHAPYSSSLHHSSTADLQWPYQAWGADAVLAAHDHTYERILLDGFPYFVNGLGGKSIYAFGVPIAGSEVRYNDDYGAMLVEADTSQITFKFIARTGEVIDTYMLGGASVPTPSSRASTGPTPAPSQTPSPTPESAFTSTPPALDSSTEKPPVYGCNILAFWQAVALIWLASRLYRR